MSESLEVLQNSSAETKTISINYFTSNKTHTSKLQNSTFGFNSIVMFDLGSQTSRWYLQKPIPTRRNGFIMSLIKIVTDITHLSISL